MSRHNGRAGSADGIDAGTMNQEPSATLASNGQDNVEQRANRFLSEVVLCHNDLLSGNVLHATGWDRVQVRETMDGFPLGVSCWGLPFRTGFDSRRNRYRRVNATL